MERTRIHGNPILIRIPGTNATAPTTSLPGIIPFRRIVFTAICMRIQFYSRFLLCRRCLLIRLILVYFSVCLLFTLRFSLYNIAHQRQTQTNELNRMKCWFYVDKKKNSFFRAHLHTRLICFGLDVQNYHHCSFNWYGFHYFRHDCPCS